MPTGPGLQVCDNRAPHLSRLLAMHTYSLHDFDFELPQALIAQHPPAVRSAARLLDARAGHPATDRVFADLPALLQAGDLLVFNDTRVLKARLHGTKASGGAVELLVERVLADGTVLAHLRASRKPAPGTRIHLCGGQGAGGFDAQVLGRWPDAHGALFYLRFEGSAGEDAQALMERFGHVPLPPYIQRPPDGQDSQRYQSIFATTPGAVAAPTAALHFDAALLAQLDARGVHRASVTLHVGAGTFAPVKTNNLAAHRMHSERYTIPQATLAALHACRARGARVVALGTTTVRALESWALSGCRAGETRIFITPGFRFAWADLLITNFHLPKSTLLMLVSAFAGHARVMQLYRHAIAQQYRFFSYGDAMLLERV